MTLYMYDAAYAPSLAKVKAHGGIAMSCYLTGIYSTTSPQPRKLIAAGLGALGNYEQAPGELLTCGVAGGRAIGAKAAAAYVAKGAPAGKGYGIAFSVDVNARVSTFPAIGKAFDGINAGLAGRFRALVYGEGALIDYLAATRRVVGVQWLSSSSSFPGYNTADHSVGLVQRVGTPVAGTDQDVITNLAALAPFIYWPPGSPYAPKPGTHPVAVATPGPPLTKEEADALLYVRFPDAPKSPSAIYAFNGSNLLYLTANDYAKLGRPAVRNLTAVSSSIFHAPAVAGTHDPRK